LSFFFYVFIPQNNNLMGHELERNVGSLQKEIRKYLIIIYLCMYETGYWTTKKGKIERAVNDPILDLFAGYY
jgi:hypothetical protein